MSQSNKSCYKLWFSSDALMLCGLVMALLSLQSNAAAAVSPIQSASEYDYPPFAIVTKDGQADGFSVEMLRETLRAVGHDVRFKVGPWHVLKQELADGRIQVLPLVGRNAERRLVYDFTAPYMSMHGTLIARKGDTRIQQLADLRDKTLVVLKGDNAEEWAREHQLTDKIITTETLEIGLRQLADGQHDALLVQKLVGENLIQKLALSNLETVGPPIERYQDFCFAVRLGDRELLATLNEGLALITVNGTAERLREKWITPTRDESYERLRQQLAIALGILLLAAFPAYLVHRSKLAEVNRRAAQLVKSEKRFQDIAYASADWIWEMDADARYTFASDTVEKVLGYTAAEIVGKTPFDQMPPAEGERVLHSFNAIARKRQAFRDAENIYLHKNGSLVHVLTNGVPILDDSGQLLGYRGVDRDITERKKAEEQLNSFLENSAVIAWMKDESGRHIFVSNNFLHHMGFSRDSVIGKTDYEIWPEELADRYRSSDKQLLSQGGSTEVVSPAKSPNGCMTWWQVHKFLFVSTGNERMIGGLAVDITERVQQEQLRIAREIEHRTTLVREVNHRIKNNLQSVSGLLHLELGKFMERDPLLKTAITQIDVIAAAHGMQSISPDEEIHLFDILLNICNSIGALMKRQLSLQPAETDGQFSSLRINKDEAVPISLVLNELILNAVKHSDPCGSPPTVSLGSDGQTAHILIRNTLNGIPDFDFDTGKGFGTGLRLLRSLLPNEGVDLRYEQDSEGFMLTRVKLTSPVILVSRQ